MDPTLDSRDISDMSIYINHAHSHYEVVQSVSPCPRCCPNNAEAANVPVPTVTSAHPHESVMVPHPIPDHSSQTSDPMALSVSTAAASERATLPHGTADLPHPQNTADLPQRSLSIAFRSLTSHQFCCSHHSLGSPSFDSEHSYFYCLFLSATIKHVILHITYQVEKKKKSGK